MSIEEMTRQMAERNFYLRAERLKEQLRGLPLPEQFRAVADFIESGQAQWAQSLARLALANLEEEIWSRKGKHGPSDVTK